MTTKKAAPKKAATKQSAPKAESKVAKVIAIIKANKKLERVDILRLIAKKLKCTIKRAGEHYYGALRRMQ